MICSVAVRETLSSGSSVGLTAGGREDAGICRRGSGGRQAQVGSLVWSILKGLAEAAGASVLSAC